MATWCSPVGTPLWAGQPKGALGLTVHTAGGGGRPPVCGALSSCSPTGKDTCAPLALLAGCAPSVVPGYAASTVPGFSGVSVTAGARCGEALWRAGVGYDNATGRRAAWVGTERAVAPLPDNLAGDDGVPLGPLTPVAALCVTPAFLLVLAQGGGVPPPGGEPGPGPGPGPGPDDDEGEGSGSGGGSGSGSGSGSNSDDAVALRPRAVLLGIDTASGTVAAGVLLPLPPGAGQEVPVALVAAGSVCHASRRARGAGAADVCTPRVRPSTVDVLVASTACSATVPWVPSALLRRLRVPLTGCWAEGSAEGPPPGGASCVQDAWVDEDDEASSDCAAGRRGAAAASAAWDGDACCTWPGAARCGGGGGGGPPPRPPTALQVLWSTVAVARAAGALVLLPDSQVVVLGVNRVNGGAPQLLEFCAHSGQGLPLSEGLNPGPAEGPGADDGPGLRLGDDELGVAIVDAALRGDGLGFVVLLQALVDTGVGRPDGTPGSAAGAVVRGGLLWFSAGGAAQCAGVDGVQRIAVRGAVCTAPVALALATPAASPREAFLVVGDVAALDEDVPRGFAALVAGDCYEVRPVPFDASLCGVIPMAVAGAPAAGAAASALGAVARSDETPPRGPCRLDATLTAHPLTAGVCSDGTALRGVLRGAAWTRAPLVAQVRAVPGCPPTWLTGGGVPVPVWTSRSDGVVEVVRSAPPGGPCGPTDACAACPPASLRVAGALTVGPLCGLQATPCSRPDPEGGPAGVGVGGGGGVGAGAGAPGAPLPPPWLLPGSLVALPQPDGTLAPGWYDGALVTALARVPACPPLPPPPVPAPFCHECVVAVTVEGALKPALWVDLAHLLRLDDAGLAAITDADVAAVRRVGGGGVGDGASGAPLDAEDVHSALLAARGAVWAAEAALAPPGYAGPLPSAGVMTEDAAGRYARGRGLAQLLQADGFSWPARFGGDPAAYQAVANNSRAWWSLTVLGAPGDGGAPPDNVALRLAVSGTAVTERGRGLRVAVDTDGVDVRLDAGGPGDALPPPAWLVYTPNTELCDAPPPPPPPPPPPLPPTPAAFDPACAVLVRVGGAAALPGGGPPQPALWVDMAHLLRLDAGALAAITPAQADAVTQLTGRELPVALTPAALAAGLKAAQAALLAGEAALTPSRYTGPLPSDGLLHAEEAAAFARGRALAQLVPAADALWAARFTGDTAPWVPAAANSTRPTLVLLGAPDAPVDTAALNLAVSGTTTTAAGRGVAVRVTPTLAQVTLTPGTDEDGPLPDPTWLVYTPNAPLCELAPPPPPPPMPPFRPQCAAHAAVRGTPGGALWVDLAYLLQLSGRALDALTDAEAGAVRQILGDAPEHLVSAASLRAALVAAQTFVRRHEAALAPAGYTGPPPSVGALDALDAAAFAGSRALAQLVPTAGSVWAARIDGDPSPLVAIANNSARWFRLLFLYDDTVLSSGLRLAVTGSAALPQGQNLVVQVSATAGNLYLRRNSTSPLPLPCWMVYTPDTRLCDVPPPPPPPPPAAPAAFDPARAVLARVLHKESPQGTLWVDMAHLLRLDESTIAAITDADTSAVRHLWNQFAPPPLLAARVREDLTAARAALVTHAEAVAPATYTGTNPARGALSAQDAEAFAGGRAVVRLGEASGSLWMLRTLVGGGGAIPIKETLRNDVQPHIELLLGDGAVDTATLSLASVDTVTTPGGRVLSTQVEGGNTNVRLVAPTAPAPQWLLFTPNVRL